MRKPFSCADMREALDNHTLMFNTKFFADLGIKNPDEVANRYADESKKSFQDFLASFGNAQQQVQADSPEKTHNNSFNRPKQ